MCVSTRVHESVSLRTHAHSCTWSRGGAGARVLAASLMLLLLLLLPHCFLFQKQGLQQCLSTGEVLTWKQGMNE